MDVYSILLQEETVRGERVAWIFRWVLYLLVAALAALVYWGQGHLVGLFGMLLALVTLLYNAVLTPLILRRRSPVWLRYLSVTIDILALTAYNALDTVFTNPFIPVTSATLLLYPLVIFVASLRLDRVLIVYATVLSVVTMDLLYVFAFPRFDPLVAARLLSIDPPSQVYRSFYVLATGVLMLFIPGTILRLLKAQQAIYEKNRDNYERAHRDRLTGLANRYHLDEVLPRELGRSLQDGTSLGLLYLDLDGFKPVNDHWGHDVGDLVLAEVGRRLSSVLRDDDLAVRVGGDEFVVVAAKVEGPATCQVLAHRIQQVLGEPMAAGDREFRIGATVGWAVFPADAQTPAGLLERADKAMLAAKKGRPR